MEICVVPLHDKMFADDHTHEGAAAMTPSAPQARWVSQVARWPLVVAVGVPATIVVCEVSPIGPDFFYVMLGIPALLIFFSLAALYAAILAVKAARVGAWHRAISYALLPAVVLPIVPEPVAFVRFCNGIGDTVHFEIMREHYVSVIKSLPDTGQPKLVVFNWGGMVWASYGVIYDESDEAALPAGKQSPDWLTRASRTELACEGYSVTPMGGHFYLADFPC
jgi:hypothetical protein